MTLADLFRDAATFVALEPEDAAATLIFAAQRSLRLQRQPWPEWPIFLKAAIPYATHSSGGSPGWPPHAQQAVEHVLAEAVSWLKREGLVMDGLVGTQAGPGKLVFTRRGLQLRTLEDVARYREASALPAALVHPCIVGRVIPLFASGDRDIAVLCAFRAVEIAVRTAAGWDEKRFGVVMMQEAFNPDNGPLTDRSLRESERKAERDLFAGAFGHGRNPVNHNDLNMGPVEAARLILLASHLLSIVEKRAAAKKAADGAGV